MTRPRIRRRAALIACGAAAAVAGAAVPASASLIDVPNAASPQVLIGADNDTTTDPILQPAGVTADQTLRKGDQLIAGTKSDVLIGRLGPDTLTGNAGDDVMVGGLERGSDATAFPNFDIAYGGDGNDAFIWAPGDGSDAFVGGEPPKYTFEKVTQLVRRNGARVRVTRTVKRLSRPDDDVLVIGTPSVLAGDNSQPELFPTSYGRLPRVNVSGLNAPATIGTAPPQAFIKGFCQVLPAPAGLGYQHIVRFFGQANRAQAVTIRVKDVERVLCRTDGADTITETFLGPKGAGPAVARTANWTAPPRSKLAALVQ
jgi:RTX calcium-binding nonapeptide repeat (4 copies)